MCKRRKKTCLRMLEQDEDLGDDVDEYEMPRRPRRKRVRSYEDDEDEDEELDVPEGFEMVMQNGRMVLRMI